VDAAIEEGRRAQGEAEENIEQMQIRRLLEKRHFDAETADRKEKERQYAFLIRRGYSASDIMAVFRELT
jgi:regulatory protein